MLHLDVVDQGFERGAVGDDVQQLPAPDPAADAPEVQLGAGRGIGVVARERERGLEVRHRRGHLQVAAAAQAGPLVELGPVGHRLRRGECGLEPPRRLAPRADRERLVGGGAHARKRVGVGDGGAAHEVVRDGARRARGLLAFLQHGRGARVQRAHGRRRFELVRGVLVDRMREHDGVAAVEQHARGDGFAHRVADLLGLEPGQRAEELLLAFGGERHGGDHHGAGRGAQPGQRRRDGGGHRVTGGASGRTRGRRAVAPARERVEQERVAAARDRELRAPGPPRCPAGARAPARRSRARTARAVAPPRRAVRGASGPHRRPHAPRDRRGTSPAPATAPARHRGGRGGGAAGRWWRRRPSRRRRRTPRSASPARTRAPAR